MLPRGSPLRALRPCRRPALAVAVLGLTIVSQFVRASHGQAPRPQPLQHVQRAMMAQQAAAGGAVPAAVNAFGNSLFSELSNSSSADASGVFVSPFSIAQALAMLLNGVEGPDNASYQQITQAVFGASQANALSLDALNAELKQLTASLVKPPSDTLTVSDANSVWVKPGLALQQPYKDALASLFGAQAQPITTAAAINDWVSQATHGKITSIVDESSIGQLALALINAVYFKGLWQTQFSKNDTVPVPFHELDGGQPLSALMYREFKATDSLRLAQLSAPLSPQPAGSATSSTGSGSVDCMLVRLPYRGGEYSAVAAMPLGSLSNGSAGELAIATGSNNGGDSSTNVPYRQALAACRTAVLSGLAGAAGLAQAGAAAPASNESAISWAPAETTVKLWLPRFEVSYSAMLNGALQALGITAPFGAGAGLTRIATEGQGGAPVTDLLVDTVLHKVYAKVDEQGTEAAAVTAVLMVRSAMLLPKNELLVKFDRPFAFFIVHEPSGVALFAGEVYKTEQWAGS